MMINIGVRGVGDDDGLRKNDLGAACVSIFGLIYSHIRELICLAVVLIFGGTGTIIISDRPHADDDLEIFCFDEEDSRI